MLKDMKMESWNDVVKDPDYIKFMKAGDDSVKLEVPSNIDPSNDQIMARARLEYEEAAKLMEQGYKIKTDLNEPMD